MHWTGIVAAVFGVPVLLLTAASLNVDDSDPAMRWEGLVAAGFLLVLVAGPIWLTQGAFTLAATLLGHGSAALWVWFVTAPLVGATLPARALVRRLSQMLPG